MEGGGDSAVASSVAEARYGTNPSTPPMRIAACSGISAW